MLTVRTSGDLEVPSLLDRLCPPDEESGTLGMPASRDTVLRDLEWLFNTESPLGNWLRGREENHPEVSASVLNFGLRNVFAQNATDLTRLEELIAEGLARFEPRLVVEQQRLRATAEGQLIEVQIDGLLLSQRATRRIVVRTDLDTSVATLAFSENLNNRG